MKFSLNLSSEPNDQYVPLAQAAEAPGYDALTDNAGQYLLPKGMR